MLSSSTLGLFPIKYLVGQHGKPRPLKDQMEGSRNKAWKKEEVAFWGIPEKQHGLEGQK